MKWYIYLAFCFYRDCSCPVQATSFHATNECKVRLQKESSSLNSCISSNCVEDTTLVEKQVSEWNVNYLQKYLIHFAIYPFQEIIKLHKSAEFCKWPLLRAYVQTSRSFLPYSLASPLDQRATAPLNQSFLSGSGSFQHHHTLSLIKYVT